MNLRALCGLLVLFVCAACSGQPTGPTPTPSASPQGTKVFLPQTLQIGQCGGYGFSKNILDKMPTGNFDARIQWNPGLPDAVVNLYFVEIRGGRLCHPLVEDPTCPKKLAEETDPTRQPKTLLFHFEAGSVPDGIALQVCNLGPKITEFSGELKYPALRS